MQEEPKLDVVFLDPGLYASEGFTSGLLIFMRNVLAKFQEHALKVGIISFVEAHHPNFGLTTLWTKNSERT